MTAGRDVEESAVCDNGNKNEDLAGSMSTIPPLNPEDSLYGLTTSQVAQSLAEFGKNEIPIAQTPLYLLFVRQFIGFLPLLIEVAALISLGIGDYADFGIILGMLFVNALLGFREEYHAKKSLDELSQQLESKIAVRRNGETETVNVTELVPGDVVLLVGGQIVPADVQYMRGDIMSVDTAALTGEPIPRKYPSKEHGDVILSGSTIVAGECYGRVLRTGESTEIGQAQADIMKDKQVRIVSVFQKKIMTVVQVLVSTSLLIVVAVLLVSGFYYNGFEDDVQGVILDSLAIMIASIPIALPLVLQVNLALGASFLAKNYHAIVTSIPALQDIASMSMLCSDKTGTLTTANMSVIRDQIYTANGYTKDQVIEYAFLCSNADKKEDPIDRAIVNDYKNTSLQSDSWVQTEIIGFNPTVKRVVAFVSNTEGKTLTIAKGLPAKILNTEAGGVDDHELQWKVDNNDKKFIRELSDVDTELSASGYKTIAVAACEGNARELGDDAKWKFVGLVPMLDPPRFDTPATIESLYRANISVKMITGDHVNVGKETARLIGLGVNIRPGEEIRNNSSEYRNNIIWDADGFAAVLPSDKREIVLTLRNHFGVVTGMTGDGVNDAAALSAAQVGIAVHDATDAAKNAADLILTEPGLSPIYGAVLESRRIFSRIKSYVIYRVAASLVLVLTLSVVIFVTGCSVDPLYVIILALLNDISMIPVAYDNAKATTKPQLPKARILVVSSLFYGFVQSSLSLLFIFAMDYDQNLNEPLDLESCSGETRAFIWLHLIFVTELMIFSVRAPSFFIFSRPSIYLVLSVLLTLIVGGLIAAFVADLSLSGQNLGYIALFNVASFIVVDLIKIEFRKVIGQEEGEVIENDELFEPAPLSETQKSVRKGLRYAVHSVSIMPPEDRHHVVEIRKRSKSSMAGFFDLGTDLAMNGGFVRKNGDRSTLLYGNYQRLEPILEGRSEGRSKQFSSPL
mmetsp:Transcript_9006/g.19166  ORF Transcript_9006/g.19166 Transcript_9006/m.19166 type:complete len:969 (+) Transcript_9006:380-3286(+)